MDKYVVGAPVQGTVTMCKVLVVVKADLTACLLPSLGATINWKDL